MNKDWLPMLCGKSYQEVPEVLHNERAEPKLDGWRAICHFDGERVHLYGGRNGANYSGRVPYLEEELADLLPPNTVVDGELVSAWDWGAVQSIMTTQEPHRPRSAIDRLRFYAFDLLRVAGTDVCDLPWSKRRSLLEVVRGDLVVPTALIPATSEALSASLAAGFEGLVVKSRESHYFSGRSPAWIKIKPQITCEAKIVGFKAGKAGGAFDGKVGSFEIVLLENGAHTTVKCGTDSRHEEATEHPERWKDVIIEIKHHGLSKEGVPRHPQFLRRRPDRMPV